MTGGRGGGGVRGAREVTIQVSGGEGGGGWHARAAVGVETLNHRWRVEGGGVTMSISFPLTLLFFFLLFLSKPLPVLHLQTT